MDLGVWGREYPIAEPDMIEVIYAEINKGEWKKGMDKESMRKKLEDLQPQDLAKLPRATKDREFNPDLTYTLPDDLPGPNGKVLYPKGFKFDPSKYVKLTGRYVILDLSDPRQRAWFDQEKLNEALDVRVISSGGSFVKLSEELKRPIYYLQRVVVERLKLKALPSIVSQKDGKVLVQEIKVPE